MGKGRIHYKATLSGPFKVAEKIKEERKSNNNRNKRRK